MPKQQPQESQDRVWADYSAAFKADVLPFLLESAFMLQIADHLPDDINQDVIKAATELGLMLLLDRPLVLVVPVGVTLPATLERAATVVVADVDMHDERSQDRIAAAVRGLARKGEGYRADA